MGIRSFLGHSDQPAAARSVRAAGQFESMTLAVASRDALQARWALLACPGAGIVRCMPMHKVDRVKLEIRFPAGQGKAVVDSLLAGLPEGEIGGVVPCAGLRTSARRSAGNVVFLHGH